MAQIIFNVDGVERGLPQPTRMMWNPPVFLGNGLNGAPTYGPYWSVDLSWNELLCPQFQLWLDAADGTLHDVYLPHPATGDMTEFEVYVRIMSPRFNTTDMCGYGAAVSGVDVQITRIALP